MPLLMQCPHCGQRMSVPDQAIGRAVRCPCGQVLQVPAMPIQGNVPPGWSGVYQQMMQQQGGFPAAQQPQYAQPGQQGTPGQQGQPGQPGQGWTQPVGQSPAQQPPGATQAPQSGWAGYTVMPGAQPVSPAYPQTGIPAGQGWPSGPAAPSGQAVQPVQSQQPGQVGPPAQGGQPGHPGEISPVIAPPSKQKKGHGSRADLETPLEMPTDVGPSKSVESPTPAQAARPSSQKDGDWLNSLPDNWVPDLVKDDDRTPAQAGIGPAASGLSAAGVGPAGPASPYGVAGPAPGGPDPAPLGQWIAEELSQPGKAKASSWNAAAGGVVEEAPVLRGRVFGGRRRFRKASEGIKGPPSPVTRMLVAIPMLILGTLHTIAWAAAAAGCIFLLSTIVGTVLMETQRNVDVVRLIGVTLGLCFGFLVGLAGTFGGYKCIVGGLGLLRNEQRGATDLATGAGTLMMLAILGIFAELVMAGVSESMESNPYASAAIAYRAGVIVGDLVLATFCLLIMLWCNSAGKRMPK